MIGPFRRRGILAGLLSLAAAPLPALAQAPGPFNDQTVPNLARTRARQPWQAPQRGATPGRGLSYDDYRQVRFRRDRWLWAGQGRFNANFFAAAAPSDEIVALHEVEAAEARPIGFDPALFDVPPSVAQAVAGAGGLNGYSGFRLLGPINRPDVWDEIGAFQGSSYFRSLGRDQAYGLSARGLSIGTGDPREEFPDFVAWWLERPAPDAASLVIHGLLDSPSCTGAYRFRVTPGDNTVFDISATIFPRRTIDKAGVAPASSMFLFDVSDPQNLRGRLNDYRSGVHDSDGLSIWTGDGRRLWRPLNNPRSLRLSTFPDTDPRGFGLIQRKRDFESYGDLEAHYHRRPSMWVEPIIPFGAGAVCLLELATQMETDDNIACFWRPSAPWQAGQEINLHYRLYFGTEPHPASLARAMRTRSGRNGDQVLFAVDFQGDALDPQALQVSASASAGAVVWSNVIAHADPGVVRATFGLRPQGPADLSLTLLDPGGGAVSETWVGRVDG